MSLVRRSDQKARVILPADFASQLLIIERINDTELLIKKGRAVRKRKYTFKELVDGITPENRHAEVETGAPIGKEILPPYSSQERRRGGKT